MDLDDAVTLADRYLDAEWDVVRAVFTEPSDDVLAARREALASLTLPSEGLAVGAAVPGRRPGMAAGEVAADNELLAYYARRPLLAVTRHDNPLWEALFGAYAGGDKPQTTGSYARLLYLADTAEGPRVVSEYDADPSSEDVRWIHLGGSVVDEPGPVVEVRRLVEPRDPRDLASWTSLEAK